LIHKSQKEVKTGPTSGGNGTGKKEVGRKGTENKVAKQFISKEHREKSRVRAFSLFRDHQARDGRGIGERTRGFTGRRIPINKSSMKGEGE